MLLEGAQKSWLGKAWVAWPLSFTNDLIDFCLRTGEDELPGHQERWHQHVRLLLAVSSLSPRRRQVFERPGPSDAAGLRLHGRGDVG